MTAARGVEMENGGGMMRNVILKVTNEYEKMKSQKALTKD